MFSSSKTSYEEFPSLQRDERTKQDDATQTGILEIQDQGTQFPYSVSSATQTDLTIDTKAEDKVLLQATDENLRALVSFLKRVEPIVCAQLKQNARSNAFSGYTLVNDAESSDTYQICKLVYPPSVSAKLECSALSWNSVGNSIAVAYSMGDHSDWCTHSSSVCIWNLQRKGFNPSKPNTVMEVDSCVSTLKFHPRHPAYIIVGKFSGEIIFWDVGKDDDVLVASTEGRPNNHREPVTGLHWLTESNVAFISCSLDGKVFVWKFNEKVKELEIQDGFVLLATNLPRHLGIRSSKADAEVGITSFSFNSEDTSVFIVGTEGGGVFQCSLDSTVPAEYTSSALNLKSPLVMSFLPHQGSVNAVHCSPHTRNLFLTCSSDGELRIYTLLQPKPLVTFCFPVGLTSARWSPARPLVITAVRKDGMMVICDLLSSMSDNVFTAPMQSDFSVSGVTLQYSHSNYNQVATGSSNGTVQIWQLSSSLILSNNKERELLQLLSAGITE